MTVHMQWKQNADAEPSLLCGKTNKYAVIMTTNRQKDVTCVDCLIALAEQAEKASQFSFRLQDCVPLGYMIDADCAVPTTPIPVYAHVDGKKVQIGEGSIDPETFLFTAKVDGNPDSQKVMEYIRGTRDKDGKTGAGMIEVSEVTLKAGVETGESKDG